MERERRCEGGEDAKVGEVRVRVWVWEVSPCIGLLALLERRACGLGAREEVEGARLLPSRRNGKRLADANLEVSCHVRLEMKGHTAHPYNHIIGRVVYEEGGGLLRLIRPRA